MSTRRSAQKEKVVISLLDSDSDDNNTEKESNPKTTVAENVESRKRKATEYVYPNAETAVKKERVEKIIKCICANEKKTLLNYKKECFPPLPKSLVQLLIVYIKESKEKRKEKKFRSKLMKEYGYKADSNDVWIVLDRWCLIIDVKNENRMDILCMRKSRKTIIPVEEYQKAVLSAHVPSSKSKPTTLKDHRNFEETRKHLIFTCSKSAIEILEKGVKYVKNKNTDWLATQSIQPATSDDFIQLDKDYSLGLENFGLSKVFIYFHIKSCPGCRVSLPAYDAILSKNYDKKIEKALLEADPNVFNENEATEEPVKKDKVKEKNRESDTSENVTKLEKPTISELSTRSQDAGPDSSTKSQDEGRIDFVLKTGNSDDNIVLSVIENEKTKEMLKEVTSFISKSQTEENSEGGKKENCIEVASQTEENGEGDKKENFEEVTSLMSKSHTEENIDGDKKKNVEEVTSLITKSQTEENSEGDKKENYIKERSNNAKTNCEESILLDSEVNTEAEIEVCENDSAVKTEGNEGEYTNEKDHQTKKNGIDVIPEAVDEVKSNEPNLTDFNCDAEIQKQRAELSENRNSKYPQNDNGLTTSTEHNYTEGTPDVNDPNYLRANAMAFTSYEQNKSILKLKKGKKHDSRNLPTFLWPQGEVQTVWHDQLTLARETNRYAKLTGIIKEIGFDLPSMYTGDNRSAETVSTKLYCAIKIVSDLIESEKNKMAGGNVSIDCTQYSKLLKEYVINGSLDVLLHDLNMLAKMNDSIVCDKTLHSLTQYAVNKLSNKPEKSDRINFDEAIDLYEALPIEELQYLSKLTDCESPQLDKNMVFTVD